MQKEKRNSADVTPTSEDAAQDATSKETVSDLEKSGETSDNATSVESTGNSSTPSPDGQFDSQRGGTGPRDKTGPM